MSGLDGVLYKWICRANLRREDLGLPIGFIEDSIAVLKDTLGTDYLEHLLLEDLEPVHFIDDEANPLRKWFLSASVDSHIVELLELSAYFRIFEDDAALNDKVKKLKRDKFWPVFFELAMAARIKRASNAQEKVTLCPETRVSIGDFTINIGNLETPCECSRLGQTPQVLEPQALEESLIRRVNKGSSQIEIPICVKIRSSEELTGNTYNRVLQLLRRAFSDCRKENLPVTHSDGLISVTFERLTERSEQKPFREVDGKIVNVLGTDWKSTMSLYRPQARNIEEIQARFDLGDRFPQHEAVRLFIKFASPSETMDPFSRLTAKLKKKLKQTKILENHRGKVVFIEVPFDFRNVNAEQLRIAIRAAAINSQTTLAIILTHREASLHPRYHYSQTAMFNANALKPGEADVMRRIELLERAVANEQRTDSILGLPFRRSWTDAQERAKKIARAASE